MSRPPIAKIVESGARRSGNGESQLAIMLLRQSWHSMAKEAGEPNPTFQQFIPVRLTTCLETSVRSALHEMIDAGGEFATRGMELLVKRNIKDVAVALNAIQEDKLTVGGLISQTQSVNSVDEIMSCLERVYGPFFVEDLRVVQDRVAVELQGNPARPIIENLDETLSRIARILEVRHRIVHELTITPPYETKEIADYFSATSDFVAALWWLIAAKLEGKFPLTQLDINEAAGKELEKSQVELSRVFELALAKEENSAELRRSQEKWNDFAEHQAQLRAGSLSEGWPGTAAGMYYASEKLALTVARTKDLARKYGIY